MKNGGQISRDALALAVNDMTDKGVSYLTCKAQIAADVIEQRDNLLTACEKLKAEIERLEKSTGQAALVTPILFAAGVIAQAKGE